MPITSQTHVKHLFPVIVGVLLVLYCTTLLLMSYQAYGQASEAGITDMVVKKAIPVGKNPGGVAVDSNAGKVYVTNYRSHTVSIIDAKQDKVVADVAVGESPQGVAVDSNAGKVYVANAGSTTVSVIASTKTG